MYHILPHKYKEYEGEKNIVVGQGELVWNEYRQGWALFGGKIIKDRNQAIKIAKKINELYHKNLIRIGSNPEKKSVITF